MAYQRGVNNLRTIMNEHNVKAKELKRVLKNHNDTLKRKMFKLTGKKEDIIERVAKNFKFRVMGQGLKKKIAFLHIGKQSSYSFNPEGTTKRIAEAQKEAQEKQARKAKREANKKKRELKKAREKKAQQIAGALKERKRMKKKKKKTATIGTQTN